MSNTQTYAVYTCNDFSANAETALSAHDVVRHIYRDDGHDYRLEPKMLTNQFDDDNNELPDVQDTTNSGLLVFEVWFKNSYGWRKSPRIAIGKDEDDAEADFLQESFDKTMWEDSYWIVLTMEQYQTDQAENAAQAAAESDDE